MNEPHAFDAHLTIEALPQVVRDLFTRVGEELLPATQQPTELFVRYLRRKPERGLAVIYDASTRQYGKREKDAPHRAVSLTLGEQALAGSLIRITSAQARNTPLAQPGAGIVQAPDLAVDLQAFPADSKLPTLAACCDTSAGSPLLDYLQNALRTLLEDEGWQIHTVRAIPVRYKPASRCVIRYDFSLTHSQDTYLTRGLRLFGKVYADPTQARAVQDRTQQLYTEQLALRGTTIAGFTQNAPFLPRSLAFIENASLVLTEAVEPKGDGIASIRTGTSVLQPRIIHERGGKVIDSQVPEHELRLAALALARLHTSQVVPDQRALRPGAKEAKRARERAALLAGYYPAQADDIQDLVQALAQRLEMFKPEKYRPAHGGFKASQLLYVDETISVVDFDGFCLADPALDVGYFLAYLRPNLLWYGRKGARAWFQKAAAIFTSTYANAMQELGASPDETTQILHRSHTYAAALLFKIATRRVNRLNSPRPQELAEILRDIASSLIL